MQRQFEWRSRCSNCPRERRKLPRQPRQRKRQRGTYNASPRTMMQKGPQCTTLNCQETPPTSQHTPQEKIQGMRETYWGRQPKRWGCGTSTASPGVWLVCRGAGSSSLRHCLEGGRLQCCAAIHMTVPCPRRKGAGGARGRMRLQTQCCHVHYLNKSAKA